MLQGLFSNLLVPVHKVLYQTGIHMHLLFQDDYISNVDEVYSVDSYDFASRDFFEVNSIEDLAEAEVYLQNRIIAYHSKNNVSFESARNQCIDASVEIGAGTRVATDVSLFGNTSIGQNVRLGENVTIKTLFEIAHIHPFNHNKTEQVSYMPFCHKWRV